MWGFNGGSDVKPLSVAVRAAVAERGNLDAAAEGLRMATKKGLYSGRPVTYFRVFDITAWPVGRAIPKRFADLDGNGVIHSGHVEREGSVVLNR